jgi:PDZ domain-containing secreted protein/Zn-dependent protease/predicted transcriptional regulator
MNSSFRILRVRGIEIGANWSWLLVFALIIWQLANGIFPSAYPGLADSSYWTMGVVTAVLFIVSLLLHELGHAFRAQKEGMEIEGITLWVFGGVAKFKGTFPSAGAEFRIAIAGPLVTVVLGLAFFGLFAGLSAAGAPDVITGVPNYLWQINTTLFLFNMIPALPLDGGRVLRSALWHRSGDFARATVSAGGIARMFAGAMIAFGTAMFIFTTEFNGVFLAMIGLFLMQASRAEEAFAVYRQTLGGVHVRDLMTPSPQTVVPSRTIESFINDVTHQSGHSTYPVVDLNGQLLGLASLRLAAGVPFDDRGSKSIRDVMLPVGSFPVLSPHDEISQILPMLRQGPGRAVVMEVGRVVGMLSMSDVARAIELEQIRDPNAVRTGRRSRRGAFVLFAVLAVVFAGVAYSPPFVVLAPGTAFDVTRDVHIKGTKTDKVKGQFLLTSVAVQQPKLFGLLAAMAEGKQTAPLDAVVPRNVDPEAYFKQQEKLFRESQLVAAAAAATAAGYDVKITGGGAVVTGVRKGGPAAASLRDNDVIVAVDGKRVRTVEDVIRAIRARPSGSSFVMRVQRGGRTITARVRSEAGILQGVPAIGAYLESKDFDVDLPFTINFRKRAIGGPSAGLSYALAVYDLLSPQDVAAGRVVAATGTIDLDGRVGPIGGIEEKVESAKSKDAEIFLVPADEVAGAEGAGLDVRGVEALKDAIQVLRATA